MFSNYPITDIISYSRCSIYLSVTILNQADQAVSVSERERETGAPKSVNTGTERQPKLTRNATSSKHGAIESQVEQ
jgi:hypothetical protein